MERVYLYCPQIPLQLIPSLIDKRFFWWNDSLSGEDMGKFHNCSFSKAIVQAKTSSWVNTHKIPST